MFLYTNSYAKQSESITCPYELSSPILNHVTAEFTVSADSDSRAADRVSFYADPNVGISAGYYIDNLSVTKIS